jgi:hypothetical protein
MLTKRRFVECEEWRKQIKLDELLPTWEYPEKEEMFKYYPQYYHKTDKVRLCSRRCQLDHASLMFILHHRTAAPSTLSSLAVLI